MTCLLLRHFVFTIEPASAKCGGLETKRKGPREEERREAKQSPSGLPLCTNFHRERTAKCPCRKSRKSTELDVLDIIVEDMYQRDLPLQNAYFFLYFM